MRCPACVNVLSHMTVGEITVDHSRRLSYPECADVLMMRRLFSVKRQITVDEYPNCGGYWLGAGGPAAIRTEFATEEEGNQAAAQHFSELFDLERAGAQGEAIEDLERTRRITLILRFICPSYYIPGKQAWGAF